MHLPTDNSTPNTQSPFSISQIQYHKWNWNVSNTQTTKVKLTIEVEVYDVIHTFVERLHTITGRTLIVSC